MAVLAKFQETQGTRVPMVFMVRLRHLFSALHQPIPGWQLILLVLVLVLLNPAASAQKFQWLGHLRGAPDYLSDDWEGPPPPGFKAWFSYARGVSSGGRVVGSFVVLPGGSSNDLAFRWEAGVFAELPLSRANFIESPGNVILGEKDIYDGRGGFVERVFRRWERNEKGEETLAVSTNSPPIQLPQNASSISARLLASGIWSDVNPSIDRRVKGVSADGTTMVGIKYVGTPGELKRRAAIWREDSETVLSLPAGTDVEMEALAVSGDGTKVVGFVHYPEIGVIEERSVAFLWTEKDGVRTIPNVAKALGIEWDETWEPEEATAISDNGRFVVGDGDRDGVYTEPWILELFPANDLIVNSIEDRSRAVGAIAGETGFILPDGRPECTLRSAIEAVNAGVDDRIRFDIPGGGIPLIQLSRALPEITHPVEIDGTTQKAGRVEVRGTASIPVGLKVTGGSSVVRGLIIHAFTGKGAACIELATGASNVVAGNYIGVDASGTIDNGETGVRISGSATNVIGGTSAKDMNIIFGRFRGIRITGQGADENVITGNRIGIGASGARLGGELGVEISHGNHNRVGSSTPGGGNIVGSISGVVLNPEVSLDGTVIEGNRIGLDAPGVEAGAPGFGVVASGFEDLQVRNSRIANNLIAGGIVNIWLLGSVDSVISGNTIGLQFNETVQVPVSPSGPSNFLYGIRADLASGAVISNNVVAGHVWDVALSGAAYVEIFAGDPEDPTDDTFRIYDPLELGTPPPDERVQGNHQIVNNRIGIEDGRKPTGGPESLGGISIFGGASSLRVAGNTVAGHRNFDIGVLNGSGHELYGNRVGTDTGADYESAIGFLVANTTDVSLGRKVSGNVVGLCSVAGIAVSSGTTNISIIDNAVGVSGTSTARPNRIGIQVSGDEESNGKPTDISILGNRVGQNQVGISVTRANPVVMAENVVGLHLDGSAATNITGVSITDSIAKLKNNIVASNQLFGIQIDNPGPNYPVLIEGGSIFGNGPGPDFGIHYETPPFPRPNRFYMTKTIAADGSGSFIFAAPPAEGPGPATFEIYGNPPDSIPQGKVSIIRQTVPANQGLAVRVPFAASSPLAALEDFRTTVTLGEATSAFSPVAESETLQLPPLEFSPSSAPGVISLTWVTNGPNLFRVVTSNSLDGPWFTFNAETTVQGARTTVTIPAGDEEAVYFRLELDPSRLSP